MKKILLIAPDFNNYTEIFSNSIDKCGYNAISLSFSAYDWRTAVCKLFHCSDKKIIDKKKTIFNKRILELYKEINPEFVIVIRGDFMERETLSSITCPRSITSFTPSLTSLSISLIISFGSLDFSLPR